MADLEDLASILAAAQAAVERMQAEHGVLDPEAQQRSADREQREHRATKLRESDLRNVVAVERAIISGSLDETRALLLTKRWVQRIAAHEAKPRSSEAPPRMLVLCGGFGSGKTVAAGWALADLGGRAIYAAELPARIDPWGDEAQRYEFVPLNTRLVVLDDLGCEVDTSARFHEALGRLIDARQGRGWTLITTNLTPAEIARRYGPRVRERLDHCGVVAEVAAASMRHQGKLAAAETAGATVHPLRGNGGRR